MTDIITISDGLMITAVIIGPIASVLIVKLLNKWSEDEKRKIDVFKDLMSTRSSATSHKHVSALNMVGIEFNNIKYSKITNIWNLYINHLNTHPGEQLELHNAWAIKKDDLISDLLYEMAITLNFNFDKLHIQKAGYVPIITFEKELEESKIRKELIDIFKGIKQFPIDVKSFPYNNEIIKKQEELQNLIKEHYEGKRAIKVEIEDKKITPDSTEKTIK